MTVSELLDRLRRERPHLVEAGEVEGDVLKVRIVAVSPFSGERSTVEVPLAGLTDWIARGRLIQDALPGLHISDRELLMTGHTDEDWRRMGFPFRWPAGVEMFPPEIDRGSLTEVSPDRFVVDASEFGLPPGDWPSIVRVLDDAESGTNYERGAAIGTGDDFAGFRYFATEGGRRVRLDVLAD